MGITGSVAMGKLCFGVDLGGTTVKMGVFTVEGSLLSDWEIPTRKEEKGKYILDDIIKNKRGGRVEADEIGVPVSSNARVLPCGSTAIWMLK